MPLQHHPREDALVHSLYDEKTGSFQYVIADPASRRAAIIDPVLDFDEKAGYVATTNADALLAHVEREGLEVVWILDTHPHADHLSAAPYLKARLGAPMAIGERVTGVQTLWKDLYGLDDLATDGQRLSLSRRELLENSGITNEMLRELESHGLIPVPTGPSAHYDATALQVACLAAQLAEFGYGPRHLRPFKLSADRELALVEQVVRPMSMGRHQNAVAQAEETARAIAALAIQLHVALVKAGLPGTIGR